MKIDYRQTYGARDSNKRMYYHTYGPYINTVLPNIDLELQNNCATGNNRSFQNVLWVCVRFFQKVEKIFLGFKKIFCGRKNKTLHHWWELDEDSLYYTLLYSTVLCCVYSALLYSVLGFSVLSPLFSPFTMCEKQVSKGWKQYFQVYVASTSTFQVFELEYP